MIYVLHNNIMYECKYYYNYVLHRSCLLRVLLCLFLCLCALLLSSEQWTTEKKYPTDVRSSLFVQTFVACVASTVDPVLLVRLLANRLVTTPLYPRNSSSITSMSGQEPFPPRLSRSRASSTDTNASTRKKRVRYMVTLYIILNMTTILLISVAQNSKHLTYRLYQLVLNASGKLQIVIRC